MKPTAGIIIPVYNGAKYLAAAIESAAALHDCDEVVVFDDGSTDATPTILAECAARHPNLRVHRTGERIPAAAAWNAAIELSSADYFTVLAHDDLLDRSFVKETITVIDQNPEIDIVFTQFRTIDSGGLPINQRAKEYPYRGAVPTAVFVNNFVEKGQHFVPSAALISRKLFYDLGGFDEKIRVAYDWDFFLRAAIAARIWVLESTLASYRIHTDQSIAAHTCQDNGDSDRLFKKYSECKLALSHNQQKLLVNNMCAFRRRQVTTKLLNRSVKASVITQQRSATKLALSNWRDAGTHLSRHVTISPRSPTQWAAWNLTAFTDTIELARKLAFLAKPECTGS